MKKLSEISEGKIVTHFNLITTIMNPIHLIILDDWLVFLDIKPQSLILSIGRSTETRQAVESFASDRGLDLAITAEVDAVDLLEGDRHRKMQQFEAAGQGLCMHITLDAFPFRVGHANWLPSVVETMTETEALFFTGTTKEYRADVDTGIPNYFKTKKVSESMLLVEADKFLGIQRGLEAEAARYGRFGSEGLLELHCQRTGEYGLKRLNSHDWRVFHTQIWDERAGTVREAFQKGGKAIDSFMNGYQDDDFHPWEKYFMYPRPSAFRRARIELGRIRREIVRKLSPFK